jgi:hypothetical protein
MKLNPETWEASPKSINLISSKAVNTHFPRCLVTQISQDHEKQFTPEPEFLFLCWVSWDLDLESGLTEIRIDENDLKENRHPVKAHLA